MPELPEVEAYRRLAEGALGREIARVEAPDAWILKRGLTAAVIKRVLRGRRFERARRVGKLLLLDTAEDGPTLGVRFGMTGRLVLDGRQADAAELIYSPRRTEPVWDRFAVRFVDGGRMHLNDARRLGGIELDPDESRLGVDLLELGLADLRAALGTSTAPLKARIMDQGRVAGIGNLIADEALWRAGLRPDRAAGGLTTAELRRLHKHLRSTAADLIERGGSHTGDVMEHRTTGGRCPRDGTTLERTTVGGRTSYWCPKHQR